MAMGTGAETSSPTWILNVQLITQDQGAPLLDLLRFPTYPLLPREVRIQSSEESRSRRRFKLAELDDFISLILHQQTNELQLDLRFEHWKIQGSDIIVTGITNL